MGKLASGWLGGRLGGLSGEFFGLTTSSFHILGRNSYNFLSCIFGKFYTLKFNSEINGPLKLMNHVPDQTVVAILYVENEVMALSFSQDVTMKCDSDNIYSAWNIDPWGLFIVQTYCMK